MRQQWRYCSLALNHRCKLIINAAIFASYWLVNGMCTMANDHFRNQIMQYGYFTGCLLLKSIRSIASPTVPRRGNTLRCLVQIAAMPRYQWTPFHHVLPTLWLYANIALGEEDIKGLTGPNGTIETVAHLGQDDKWMWRRECGALMPVLL